MTATFGGLITEAEITLYDHVSITVLQLESSLMMMYLNPIISEILLFDNFKIGFRYCESNTKAVSVSVFAIFVEPFDKFTWAAMVAAIIGIIYYVYLKSKSILDSLFEVVKLVLQRTSDQKYKFGVLFLFGFFFWSFSFSVQPPRN